MRAWILSLLLVATPALSQPETAVQWLMNDPVTLFDRGIESLNQHLDEDLRRRPESAWRKPWLMAAEYDHLTDRLYIVSRVDLEGMSVAQFRDWCETAFSEIRTLLRVDERGVANSYDDFFSHRGLPRADRPDDLAERLSAMTVLVARGDKDNRAHICDAPLASESISYRSEEITGPWEILRND